MWIPARLAVREYIRSFIDCKICNGLDWQRWETVQEREGIRTSPRIYLALTCKESSRLPYVLRSVYAPPLMLAETNQEFQSSFT